MTRGEITSTYLKAISVDDSPVMAERMAQLFEDIPRVLFLGHARTISDALQLVQKEEPDVAILDIHLDGDMPERNGMDLLTLLRKKYPEMTIIMLTNLSQPQYRDSCMNLGANYFLDKSNDFEMVPDILRQLNEKKNRHPN